MEDQLDEQLKNICRQMPRHELGKSLWFGVQARISARKNRRRPRAFLLATAGAFAALLIVFSLSSKPRKAAPEVGPYYEEADPGPVDLFGESGRQGLPQQPQQDA